MFYKKSLTNHILNDYGQVPQCQMLITSKIYYRRSHILDAHTLPHYY